MVYNPITEDIRAIRHRLAAEFDNDIQRIGGELRRRQEASGRRLIRLPKRTPEMKMTNDAPPPNGEPIVPADTPANPAVG